MESTTMRRIPRIGLTIGVALLTSCASPQHQTNQYAQSVTNDRPPSTITEPVKADPRQTPASPSISGSGIESQKQAPHAQTKDEAMHEMWRHDKSGYELLAKGDAESALREFNLALDSASRGGFGRDTFPRSLAYIQLKHYDLADADLTCLVGKENAIGALMRGEDVYYFRGHLYELMKENEKAMSDYSSGVELASQLLKEEKQGSIVSFKPAYMRSSSSVNMHGQNCTWPKGNTKRPLLTTVS